MKEYIRGIANKFPNSRPIFIATLSESGEYLSFEVKNDANPVVNGPPKDPVECLVALHWGENFDRRNKRYDTTINEINVFQNVMNQIRKVYYNYSGLKNPKQSKLHKWLQEASCKYNAPTAMGFVALYRYICTHQNNNKAEFTNGENNPHVKNVLAILEKMREKYEKQ